MQALQARILSFVTRDIRDVVVFERLFIFTEMTHSLSHLSS